MRSNCVLPTLVMLLTLACCNLPANAELSPSKVKELRDQSEEVLKVKVLAVTKGELVEPKDPLADPKIPVTYSVKVEKVIRSKSGVKPGEELQIESYIRPPAPKDAEGKPLFTFAPGPLPPSLLALDWVGTVYLDGTKVPGTLKISVFGHSFVQDKGAGGEQTKQPAAIEDINFFEQTYKVKLDGIKPKAEYKDPDQFYSLISQRLDIPSHAMEAAALNYGWRRDDGRGSKVIVKRAPGQWQVMVVRFQIDPATQKPNPASLELKTVVVYDDKAVSFPE